MKMIPRSILYKSVPVIRLEIRRQLTLNVKALHDRGLISNVFPDLNEKFVSRLAAGKVAAYAGFDPTASSLHMGSLLPLIGLLRLQRSGIKPVVVIGEATALVGDPSGKRHERDSITSDTIAENSRGIRKNVADIFANHQTYFWKSETKTLPAPRVLSNMEWYEKMNPVKFLGKIGRHFRMGTMLLKESVSSRLNGPEGMSFAEFSYQAFQAYDWLHLYADHDCYLQLGGNDQFGNMVAGHDLIKRVTGESAHCLTVPLVVSETGDKLGKTSGNAVWLDDSKTSAFEFYQFFLRLPDSEVEKYLKLFTFLSEEEITSLMTSQAAKPELRKPHKKLAEQVTLLVHGERGLTLARHATNAFFGSDIKALAALDPDFVAEIFGRAFVSNQTFNFGTTLLDVVMNAKCFADQRDARKVISAGGVQLNFQKMQTPDEALMIDQHKLPNNISLIRIGKKNYYVVRWNT